MHYYCTRDEEEEEEEEDEVRYLLSSPALYNIPLQFFFPLTNPHTIT